MLQAATKFGYLTITLWKLVAYSHTSGHNCDFFIGDWCDPFVKVLVNSEYAYSTGVYWDTKHLFLNKTFTTKKIDKNSIVTFEIWDYDRASTHDLILSWDISVKKLLKTHEKITPNSQNKLYVNATWVDDEENTTNAHATIATSL